MESEVVLLYFFFNDPAPTEIYSLPLHDPLPIGGPLGDLPRRPRVAARLRAGLPPPAPTRAVRRRPLREIGEHTSELQSRQYLVCRLLLETKKRLKQFPQHMTLLLVL